MMDVLGLKASEAHFIVDPYEGVQVTDNDVSHLRRVVERYLQDKGKKTTNVLEFPVSAEPEMVP